MLNGQDSNDKAVVVVTSEYKARLLLLSSKILKRAALVPVFCKIILEGTDTFFAMGDFLFLNDKCFAIFGFTIKDNDVVVHFLVYDLKKSQHYDGTATVINLMELANQPGVRRHDLSSQKNVRIISAVKKKLNTYTFNPKSSTRQSGMKSNFAFTKVCDDDSNHSSLGPPAALSGAKTTTTLNQYWVQKWKGASFKKKKRD